MTSERGRMFGFAVEHDAPIPYLQRIRDYYEAPGYGAPYEWAHCSEVPFHPLARPLSKCRVAIITTAAPYQPDKGDQGPGVRRFHGAPMNRSHRVTLEIDCREIVTRCSADEVDVAVLVPNCPVCHQTMSLTPRPRRWSSAREP